MAFRRIGDRQHSLLLYVEYNPLSEIPPPEDSPPPWLRQDPHRLRKRAAVDPRHRGAAPSRE